MPPLAIREHDVKRPFLQSSVAVLRHDFVFSQVIYACLIRMLFGLLVMVLSPSSCVLLLNSENMMVVLGRLEIDDKACRVIATEHKFVKIFGSL